MMLALTAPADYVNTIQLLQFSPTVDAVSVNVPIINDTVVENDETFFALLDTQGQPVFLGVGRRTAEVLIVEDPSDGKP